ncbi:hypothetical protein GT354_02890, partial [Streptomyces sp. SID3343]|nr:hypothetical protein [Streptomyces sp. SID3343]
MAAAGFAPGRRADVLRAGPRSLWTEVENTWRWWDRVGRPEVFSHDRNDLGMSAIPTLVAFTEDPDYVRALYGDDLVD